MGEKTELILHRQYATYQTCVDIYSKKLSVDEVYKKTFLYIIDWLKGRIGTKKVNEYEELKKYPAPSEYMSRLAEMIKNKTMLCITAGC
ncbi:MAG: hypothetical protein J5988_06065 [Eubacterium sp.]|nr:hypothetical protein [Eubacterium sp.]